MQEWFNWQSWKDCVGAPPPRVSRASGSTQGRKPGVAWQPPELRRDCESCKQLIVIESLIIFPRQQMERCKSGLIGSPGKTVWGQLHRGFESLSLRHRISHRLLVGGLFYCLMIRDSNGEPGGLSRPKPLEALASCGRTKCEVRIPLSPP